MTFRYEQSELLDVVYNIDLNVLCIGTYDATILCFDPRSNTSIASMVGHNWEGKLK